MRSGGSGDTEGCLLMNFVGLRSPGRHVHPEIHFSFYDLIHSADVPVKRKGSPVALRRVQQTLPDAPRRSRTSANGGFTLRTQDS